jgi:hypothetical protein
MADARMLGLQQPEPRARRFRWAGQRAMEYRSGTVSGKLADPEWTIDRGYPPRPPQRRLMGPTARSA